MTLQEHVGATGTLKTLEHLYKSKQAAKRAALHAWHHIEDVRNILRENSDEPWKRTQTAAGTEAA